MFFGRNSTQFVKERDIIKPVILMRLKRYTFLKVFLFVGIGFFPVILSAQSADELLEELQQTSDVPTQIILNYQLAETYLNSRDYKSAQRYGKESFRLAEAIGKNSSAAQAAFLLGRIYIKDRNDRNADVWFETAYKSAKAANDADLMIKSVVQRSRIAKSKRNFRDAYNIVSTAFEYFSERGKSISELEQQYDIQRNELAKEKTNLEREIKALAQERDQLAESQQILVKEKKKVERQISRKEEELATVAEEKEKAEEVARERQQEVRELTREKLEDKAVLEATRADLEEEKRIKTELELEKAGLELQAANRRILIIILISLALFILGMTFFIYLRYRAKKRTTDILSEKNVIIENERKRSDDLLLNILPINIANELKETGKAAAKRYENASVLFTDFKDFSRISEKLTPEQLVSELDYCFKGFDAIIEKYDIEKIKTIGDAYMCASGLSDRRSLPLNIVSAALDMQQFMREYKRERIRRALPYFEARIGIHTGPVVAGVVGTKKFAYDIWGPTVNVAARMESKCEVGKVNISDSTFRQVKYKFNCIPRGKIEAKNVGFIEMYYAETRI